MQAFEKEKAIWEKDHSQPEPVFKSREQLLKEYPTLDSTNNFNYAICGQSGVGKSSFVNSLMGLRPKEEGPTTLLRMLCQAWSAMHVGPARSAALNTCGATAGLACINLHSGMSMACFVGAAFLLDTPLQGQQKSAIQSAL